MIILDKYFLLVNNKKIKLQIEQSLKRKKLLLKHLGNQKMDDDIVFSKGVQIGDKKMRYIDLIYRFDIILKIMIQNKEINQKKCVNILINDEIDRYDNSKCQRNQLQV
ncbi:unnamed protein product [Paramecium sonneborni]|uniref:Uncharacterized protein n=1 Tax=Paramecium sonneborni TaxID=65129 RepID=A0A8S1N8S1_9CILI|nr:unnamed protein product [Paramecium sonneborni]